MPEDNPTPALPPSLQWTARADWIDAEDGTVVCLAPFWESPGRALSASDALWPERRAMLAAAPALLAALQTLCTMRDMTADDLAAAWDAARAAIAAARAS